MFSQIAAKLASLTSPKSKPVIANQDIFEKLLSQELDEKEVKKLSQDARFQESLFQIIHMQDRDKLFLACTAVINTNTQLFTIFSSDHRALECFNDLYKHLLDDISNAASEKKDSELSTKSYERGDGTYGTGRNERFYFSKIETAKYCRLFLADLEKIAAEHPIKFPDDEEQHGKCVNP